MLTNVAKYLELDGDISRPKEGTDSSKQGSLGKPHTKRYYRNVGNVVANVLAADTNIPW